MPSDRYIPISCNYYDYLEAFATKKEKILIRYLGEDNREISTRNIIMDFVIKNGIEFMILDDGNAIRLDRIISASGLYLIDYQKC